MVTTAELVDNLLKSIGFEKVAEFRWDDLKPEVRERCKVVSGYGGCLAQIEGEVVLAEQTMYGIGAIAVWVELEAVSYILPYEDALRSSCYTEIALVGDTEAGEVIADKWVIPKCVVPF